MIYCADTWFLLELVQKRPKAIELLRKTGKGNERVVVPITVYAEATRKLLHHGGTATDAKELYDYLVENNTIIVTPIDTTIALEAVKIAHTYELSMMDAFVAATTKLHACDTLLTKDGDYAPLVKAKYLRLTSW